MLGVWDTLLAGTKGRGTNATQALGSFERRQFTTYNCVSDLAATSPRGQLQAGQTPGLRWRCVLWHLLLTSTREIPGSPPAAGVRGEPAGPPPPPSAHRSRGSRVCWASISPGRGGSMNASLCAGLHWGSCTPSGMRRAGWKMSGWDLAGRGAAKIAGAAQQPPRSLT